MESAPILARKRQPDRRGQIVYAGEQKRGPSPGIEARSREDKKRALAALPVQGWEAKTPQFQKRVGRQDSFMALGGESSIHANRCFLNRMQTSAGLPVYEVTFVSLGRNSPELRGSFRYGLRACSSVICPAKAPFTWVRRTKLRSRSAGLQGKTAQIQGSQRTKIGKQRQGLLPGSRDCGLSGEASQSIKSYIQVEKCIAFDRI